MTELVLATHNPAKKKRYSRLFSGIASEIVSLDDLGIKERPMESGDTAEENARIKASFYYKKTGLPVFAEDEALYVDFLPEQKQPGVNVRRIDGIDEATDEQILKYWEDIVLKVSPNNRTGYWHVAYVLIDARGNIKTVSIDYPILFFSPSSKIKIQGWPMSSLGGPSVFNKPHSALTEEERADYERRSNKLIIDSLMS